MLQFSYGRAVRGGRNEISKSQREYMETKLADLEHDRSRQLLGAMSREYCLILSRPRRTLKLREDPSPIVLKLANHIEEDAREVAALEALRERELERDDVVKDRSKRGHRGRGQH